ncbi:MAG: L,D-transpeptidase family protein [Anaerolineae bacterium]|nr:L,D-transpeptidase family protein [Anaerolineae bacterium]
MQYTNRTDKSAVPKAPPVVSAWRSRPHSFSSRSEQPTQFFALAPARPDHFWSRFTLLALAVTLLSLFAAALGSYTLFAQSDTIFPAVSVMGVKLGGLTQSQAELVLAQTAQTTLVQVQIGDQLHLLSLTELGYTLDGPDLAHEAWQRGRSQSSWSERFDAFFLGVELAPHWQFIDPIAQASLAQLAQQTHQPAVPPDLVYQQGQVHLTPGRPGQRLDESSALEWLRGQSPQGVAGRIITLPMVPEEPVMGNLAEQAAAANTHLRQSIVVPAFDPVTGDHLSWSIPSETWNSWVIPHRDPTSPTGFDFTLESSRVVAYFQMPQEALTGTQTLNADEAAMTLLTAYTTGNWPGSLRIYHTSQQHIVQPGETFSSIARGYGMPYPWLEQANSGLTGLYPGQQITIPSPDLFLPLPVVENKRIIISLSQQRMWAYENGELRWEWVVSTGIAESPTSPGVYQVQTHVDNAYAANWDLWMPYFIGIYRPVPSSDFMNGFHGFPTRGSSQLLWTNSLGRPVTYGCVLVSNENAAALYTWAEAGVIVEVRP